MTSSSSSARTPQHDAAANIAERFRQAVRRPLDTVPAAIRDRGQHRGRRLGVRRTRAEPTTDLLLRIADEAMYASKDAGRDRVTMTTIDNGTNTTHTRLDHDQRPETGWEH